METTKVYIFECSLIHPFVFCLESIVTISCKLLTSKVFSVAAHNIVYVVVCSDLALYKETGFLNKIIYFFNWYLKNSSSVAIIIKDSKLSLVRLRLILINFKIEKPLSETT